MSYSEEFKIFVSTINGEAENCSETSWKVIAHSIRNRVGFANWKSWVNKREIIEKTGYDAFTDKNEPYRRAKKELDSGEISSKVKKLIEAVEPIFYDLEDDFTGGVVYYFSPNAQASLHKSNPSRYKKVPAFLEDSNNPVHLVRIPGTEKDDLQWYKVIRSKFIISFVDKSGSPLVGESVDVIYADKKRVPLFSNLKTDNKGRIKVVYISNYMAARFKVNGVLVKDDKSKEVKLLGDGKNYSTVIVVDTGKGGIKAKTEVHNQKPTLNISDEKKSQKLEENNNIENDPKGKNVIFDLKILDSDGKPIPNISFFLKYKGSEKKHSTASDGVEKNIRAEVGEEIVVLVSGKDSKQEIGKFSIADGISLYTIKINLHKFEILFRHSNTKKAITNLNLIQIYRGIEYTKKTNEIGIISINAMPGFDLNYKLKNGKNLISIKVDKNKSMRVLDINSAIIEQATQELNSNQTNKKDYTVNNNSEELLKEETQDVTPQRDQKKSTSSQGHPKTVVKDSGDAEFMVLTYDKKTSNLFSGGNYLIEYNGKKRNHVSGTHGVGKKLHKGEIDKNIKIIIIENDKELMVFTGTITKNMKLIEIKLEKPTIKKTEGVTIEFNGVNEQYRRDIVSQKTKDVLASLAKEAQMDKLYITSTIRTPRAQAEAMYIKTTRYAAPGEAVKKVKEDCIAKGMGKEETIQKMIDKIIEFSNKGQRVSKHCVTEQQYKKNNIIDLGMNSNGFGKGNTLNSVGKRFKVACEKALKDGIISGFISADVPGEGAMHIEIIQ